MSRLSLATPDTTVPMLALPPGLPLPAILLVTAVALAVLDMGGAIAAKNWAMSHSNVWFVAGLAFFAVLFWIYGSALQYAELSVVTMGWIVMLQVGLLVVDRVQYDVAITPGQWLAIGGVLALQGYLVVSSS
jgi:FtsH-binding integral membrane protein